VRFAARLGFAIEPRTMRAIRELVGEIGVVSAERVREELTKILTEGAARRGFELLDESGLLAQVLPEVARMKGVAQPPEYHPEGDVWVHTLMLLEHLGRPETNAGVLRLRLEDDGEERATANATAKTEADPYGMTNKETDAGFLRPSAGSGLEDDGEERATTTAEATANTKTEADPCGMTNRETNAGVLRLRLEDDGEERATATATLAWGMLLHDVGKPATFTPPDPARVGDRIRFNGHVEVGMAVAREILNRLRFSNDDAAQVLALIQHHMQFGDVMKMKQSTLKRFLRLPKFEEHLALHYADCMSAHGMLGMYEFARAQYEGLRAEEVRPALLVTGAELIAEGYKPGPAFKAMLEATEDAQLEGVVSTREEALAWVRERFPLVAQ